jgi:hypothetical protein
MARRRSMTIDGGNIFDNMESSIRKILEGMGKQDATQVVGDGQLITQADLDRPMPQHNMITNLIPVEKGATLRDQLLDQEFGLIALFLAQFPERPRFLEMDENTLIIRAFPLPDEYLPEDHIDLLFVIRGYYEVPPIGVHIPSTSPNRQKIAERLGGHVQNNSSIVLNHTPARYRKYVEELAGHGWDWVCLHYRDYTWDFRPYHLLSGDCLYKFSTENVFAVLSVGFKD